MNTQIKQNMRSLQNLAHWTDVASREGVLVLYPFKTFSGWKRLPCSCWTPLCPWKILWSKFSNYEILPWVAGWQLTILLLRWCCWNTSWNGGITKEQRAISLGHFAPCWWLLPCVSSWSFLCNVLLSNLLLHLLFLRSQMKNLPNILEPWLSGAARLPATSRRSPWGTSHQVANGHPRSSDLVITLIITLIVSRAPCT